MPFTLAQQKALAVAPMVSGILSLCGSGCIIRVLLAEKPKKLESTYHRILFAMSTVDMTAAIAVAFSTLPIPENTPGVWIAKGNVATCTLQGFFMQPATWIPALNASLAVYYLLVSRYGWTQDRIRKLEPLLIGVPLLLGYGTSIACAAMSLFNNANLWCWIAPFPQGCKESFRYGNEANCIRGDNASLYRYFFAYGPMWCNIVIATCCLAMVHWTVLKQEKEVDKFQENGVAVRTQSKRIFWQSLWYVTAFYVTWTPSTVLRIMQGMPQTLTQGNLLFALVLLVALLLPLQGFWNFLVFSRARYHKYKRENPSDTMFGAIKVAAFAITSSGNLKVTADVCSTPNSAYPGVHTEHVLQSEMVK